MSFFLFVCHSPKVSVFINLFNSLIVFVVLAQKSLKKTNKKWLVRWRTVEESGNRLPELEIWRAPKDLSMVPLSLPEKMLMLFFMSGSNTRASTTTRLICLYVLFGCLKSISLSFMQSTKTKSYYYKGFPFLVAQCWIVVAKSKCVMVGSAGEMREYYGLCEKA